jgi:hypothetical protein
MAGQEYPAHIISTRTPPLATALAELARENAGVDRVLRRIVEGTALGGVVLASAAILVPIGQYYGMVPGADPFAFMYPPVENPRRKPQKMEWSRQPAQNGAPPTTQGEASPQSVEPVGIAQDFTPQVPGSPPGVVTVSHGPAPSH